MNENGEVDEEFLREFLYPEEVSPSIQRKIELFQEYIPAKGTVLDAGCGPGYVSRALSRSGFEVFSLEIEGGSLKACKYAMKMTQTKSHLVRASVTNLPFKSGEFDCVVCSEVLEHITGVDRALSDFFRILKGGGKLCISVPGPTYRIIDMLAKVVNFKSKYRSWVLKNWKLCGLEASKKAHYPHIHKFTPGSISRFLKNSGFELLEFKNIYCFAPFFSAFFMSLLGKKRRWIKPMEKLDVSLARHLPLFIGSGWTIICEKTPIDRVPPHDMLKKVQK